MSVGVSGSGRQLGGAKPTGAAALSVPAGYILERSSTRHALLPCPWGKLGSRRQEPLVPVVPERCAHVAGRVTSCFGAVP
jgi:hypothetical protein